MVISLNFGIKKPYTAKLHNSSISLNQLSMISAANLNRPIAAMFGSYHRTKGLVFTFILKYILKELICADKLLYIDIYSDICAYILLSPI